MTGDEGITEFVEIAKGASGVAIITINRPERRNALSLNIKRSIERAIRTCDADPDVRIVILTGAGGCFVAGTDIAEMVDMTPTFHLVEQTDGMFKTLRASPKILIAAVEGYALGGGCELALCCDLIIAGRQARFGQPEIRVGIMRGGGGTQVLVRAIGKARAMLMILTGEPIVAPEALTMGLISEVVDDGQALIRAVKIAETVAGMPPLAVRAIKEVVDLGADVPLQTALTLERKAFVSLFDTEDQKEGMRAFLEKRRPRYQGR